MACCPSITLTDESWMTDALSRRLLTKDTGPPQVKSDVSAWLTDIRYSVHDYDERSLDELKASKENSGNCVFKRDSEISSDVSKFIEDKIIRNGSDLLKDEEGDEFSNAFDVILSDLGNEIYKLNTYQEKHFSDVAGSVQDFSGFDDSFMEIFDDCLQCIRASTPSPEAKSDVTQEKKNKNMELNLNLNLPLVNKNASFGNISTLSDEVFMNSRTPSRDGSKINVNVEPNKIEDEVIVRRDLISRVQCKHSSFDINRIFDKGQGAPVPPRRKYRQTNPFSSEHTPKLESRPLSKIEILRAKFDNKDNTDRTQKQIKNGSCSDSGNNSSNSTSDYSDYQNLWNCSSGCRKPPISPVVKTFKENYGSENAIRYDSLRDISNSPFDISKEKMVQACCKRSRSGSAKTESETDTPSRLLSVPLEGAHGARHYSYDGRKQPEVVAIRLSERDMIKCTSECDMTDECHRALHKGANTSEHHYVNTCDVYKGSFGNQHSYSTVPRVDKKNTQIRNCDVISLPENIEQFASESNIGVEPKMGKAYENRAERRGTNNSCGSDQNTSDLKDSALECCDEWISDTASACGTDLLNANAVDEDWSSVEIISDAESLRTPPWGRWRTPSNSTAGASESPVYENLRDVRAAVRQRPPPPDVAAWKAALLDPYCNEDEEDEWISPEESLIYSKDQSPPFIIPRIKNYRPRHYSAENEGTPSSAKKAGVGETIPAHLQHAFEEPKSPTIKDVRKMFEEKGVSLPSNESPKFIRLNKWTGGSNEFTSKASTGSKTSEQQAVELRNRDLESLSRSHGKVKSMVTSTQWKPMLMPPRVLPRDYEPTDYVLFEGSANRTRLTENGKKLRKNWQTNYLVLTQTSLAFYKDIKGYHAMKLAGSLGTPPANSMVPEMIFPLAGALVSASTPQHTRRANAYVLTSVKHLQVIIQHDEPIVAKKWFDTILRAINKLPSDYTCPDNSMVQSPLPTPSPVQKRIPRSKSSSKVPESSMEDLSDPTEQTKIRSKLKKFFVRRPTMESLVRKGIYKDEPVFGQSLEEVCPKTDPRIPEFVIRCVEVIESSEENMASDGLYRASGNLSQVQKIRLEVDQNNLSIMENEVDVHVLTGALKLFFRELKEPLIPCRLFQRALNASANRVHESKIKEFREIVHSLPECNRQTLMFLLQHLLRVTERKEKNRMHIANLAIVLGPTLLWAPSEAAHNIAVDCLQQNQVIETFLADYDSIFKEEGRRK